MIDFDPRSGLQTIDIEGFRSIRSTNLALNAGLNVLIGANGAGKSNFIRFFQMLGEMIDPLLGLQRHVAQGGGQDALFFRGPGTTSTIRAALQFDKARYAFALEAADDGVGVFFAAETIVHEAPSVALYAGKQGHRESRLQGDELSEAERWTAAAIGDWRVFHFHNTSPTAALMRPVNAVDSQALRANAGNIAAVLFRLRREHKRYYDRIIRHIRQAAPFFGDFVLECSSTDQVHLLWREQGSENIFYPAQLSDGTIRFICLATLLLQPSPPSTILIDEPELGLHPSAITALAAMLRLAEERTQLIVSTQSGALVDHLEIEDLIVVDRQDGASAFRRLERAALKEWIDDYSLGALWDKNLLGGMP